MKAIAACPENKVFDNACRNYNASKVKSLGTTLLNKSVEAEKILGECRRLVTTHGSKLPSKIVTGLLGRLDVRTINFMLDEDAQEYNSLESPAHVFVQELSVAAGITIENGFVLVLKETPVAKSEALDAVLKLKKAICHTMTYSSNAQLFSNKPITPWGTQTRSTSYKVAHASVTLGSFVDNVVRGVVVEVTIVSGVGAAMSATIGGMANVV